jgi:hypothetical protein
LNENVYIPSIEALQVIRKIRKTLGGRAIEGDVVRLGAGKLTGGAAK